MAERGGLLPGEASDRIAAEALLSLSRSRVDRASVQSNEMCAPTDMNRRVFSRNSAEKDLLGREMGAVAVLSQLRDATLRKEEFSTSFPADGSRASRDKSAVNLKKKLCGEGKKKVVTDRIPGDTEQETIPSSKAGADFHGVDRRSFRKGTTTLEEDGCVSLARPQAKDDETLLGNSYYEKIALCEHRHVYACTKRCRCDVCRKALEQNCALLKHVFLRSGEKPFACQFCKTEVGRGGPPPMPKQPQCDGEHSQKKFPSLSLPPGAYECSVSKNQCVVKKNVHPRAGPHTESEPYVCQQGTKELSSQQKSSAHNKRAQLTTKELSSQSQLAKHKDISHRDTLAQAAVKRQPTCKQCGAVFSRQTAFRHHQRQFESEAKNVCGECGKKFCTKRLLADHMKRHVAAGPVTCDVCSRTMCNVDSYRRHKRLHTKELLHQCDLCPKRFFYKSHLARHMNVHTGDRLYVCDQCGKAYLSRGGIYNHLKTHEAKVPLPGDEVEAA